MRSGSECYNRREESFIMEKASAREFISKVKTDEKLKVEAFKAFKEGRIIDFAAKFGYKITEAEVRDFADKAEGEIPLEDLESYSAACSSNSVPVNGATKQVGMMLC